MQLANTAGVLVDDAGAPAHVRCAFENYAEGGAGIVPLTSLAFSPDGNKAAVGDFHGRVTLLHLRNEIVYRRLDIFAAWQTSHFVSASSSNSRTLPFRATRRHCPIQHLALSSELLTPRSGFVTLVFAASFNALVATPHLPDDDGESAMRLTGHEWQITALSYVSADNGGWLVSSSKDRTIIWDCPHFRRLRVLRDASCFAVPLRLGSENFLFGCDGSNFGLWDFELRVVDSVHAEVWCDHIEAMDDASSFAFTMLATQRGGSHDSKLAAAVGPVGASGAALVTAMYSRQTDAGGRAAAHTIGRAIRALKIGQRVQEVAIVDGDTVECRISLLLADGTIEIRSSVEVSKVAVTLRPWDLCLPTVVPRRRRALVAAAVRTANLQFYSARVCQNHLLTLVSGGRAVLFDAAKTLAVAARKSVVNATMPVEILTPPVRVITGAINLPRRDVTPAGSAPSSPTSPQEKPPALSQPQPAERRPVSNGTTVEVTDRVPAPVAVHSRGIARQAALISGARLEIPVIRLPSNLFFLYTHPGSDVGWEAPRVSVGLKRLLGNGSRRNCNELRWVKQGDVFISEPARGAGERPSDLSLDLIRSTYLQKPPFCFPETLRADLWTLLLQLPRNQAALDCLAAAAFKGGRGLTQTEAATAGERQKKKLLKLLAAWAPVLQDFPWVGDFVTPLVETFGRRPLFCFETAVGILTWWGFLGCRFFRCEADGPTELSAADSDMSFTSACETVVDDGGDNSGGGGQSGDNDPWTPTLQLAGWQWFDSHSGESPPHLALLSSFLLSRVDPELWEHAARCWGMAVGLNLENLGEQTADLARGEEQSSKIERGVRSRDLEKLHLRIGHRLLWPLIRTFCAQVLPTRHVPVLWDHLLSQPGRPLLPVAAAVAVVNNLRNTLLQEHRWTEAMAMLHSRRPQNMQIFLERCYQIDSEISSDIFPLLATHGGGRELCLGMRRPVAVSLENLGWPAWKGTENNAAATYPYLVRRGREQEVVNINFLQHQSERLLLQLKQRMANLEARSQEADDDEALHILSVMAKLQGEIRLETELHVAVRNEQVPQDVQRARKQLQKEVLTRQKLLALCNEAAATMSAASERRIQDSSRVPESPPSRSARDSDLLNLFKQARVLSEELRHAQQQLLTEDRDGVRRLSLDEEWPTPQQQQDRQREQQPLQEQLPTLEDALNYEEFLPAFSVPDHETRSATPPSRGAFRSPTTGTQAEHQRHTPQARQRPATTGDAATIAAQPPRATMESSHTKAGEFESGEYFGTPQDVSPPSGNADDEELRTKYEVTRRMLTALRRGRRATEERKRSTSEPPADAAGRGERGGVRRRRASGL